MNPDDTDPDHHVTLPPTPTRATTAETIHSEPVPRSTSPRIDVSKPSSVLSTSPLHPIPPVSSSLELKDDPRTSSIRLSSTRPLPMLPHEDVPQFIRISQPIVSDQARSITLDRRVSLAPPSQLDYIIPYDRDNRVS